MSAGHVYLPGWISSGSELLKCYMFSLIATNMLANQQLIKEQKGFQ